MIRVAVIGATGYAGAELVRILAGHPNVELTAATSRQYAGRAVGEVYPALNGAVSLTCEAYDADAVAAVSDAAVLALPHELSMTVVPDLLARGLRVVDLSADFRFDDPDRYASAYQPHSAPELLAETVYGLSEIYGEQVAGARLVGNPGCYPTSVLLPLVPLVRRGLVETDFLVADAKSGVSGAGRSLSLATHFCEVHESFKPYKVAAHRHNPEMDMVLSREAGESVHLTFVPHLVPMSRGMQTTIYARSRGGADAAAAMACLGEAYQGSPFVRLLEAGQTPATRSVRGTNFCDIAVSADPVNGRLIVMSAIDNLVKGASGQAVQNLNLMFGLDETAGLDGIPYPL